MNDVLKILGIIVLAPLALLVLAATTAFCVGFAQGLGAELVLILALAVFFGGVALRIVEA